MTAGKIIPSTLLEMKQRGEKIASLTAYDFPMAKLLDEAGLPLILVGDSLGMVVLGYPDTTHVTMAEMEHHIRAVARAGLRALLAADLPYRTYETPSDAVRNSRRLLAAGAEAVKAEGGRPIAKQIKAIIREGIPFLGHLGMLPQHILEEGRYRIKGRREAEREALLADAQTLVELGAMGIVLELVAAPVAAEITQSVPIPTIGIGSGPDCDGQILVVHDLIGMFPWFTPKFIQPQIQTAARIQAAVRMWMSGLPSAPPRTEGASKELHEKVDPS